MTLTIHITPQTLGLALVALALVIHVIATYIDHVRINRILDRLETHAHE